MATMRDAINFIKDLEDLHSEFNGFCWEFIDDMWYIWKVDSKMKAATWLAITALIRNSAGKYNLNVNWDEENLELEIKIPS